MFGHFCCLNNVHILSVFSHECELVLFLSIEVTSQFLFDVDIL